MRFASQPYIEGGLPIADTVSLVTSNLASGNWRGAINATYSPESASPEERRKLSNRLGLTGTFLEPLVNIATNPMTIIGAILTWKFGLPALRSAVTSDAGVAGLKKTIPLLEKLSGPRVVFGGTSIPDDLEHAAFRFKDYLLKFNERILGAWKKGGYADGVVPDEATLLRISAKLDGIDSDAAGTPQARRMWSILREQLNSPEKLGYTKVEADALRQKLWTKSGSPISIQLSESETKVMEELRQTFRDTYKEVIDPAGGSDEYLHALGFARGNTRELNELEWYWPHLNKSTFIERQRSLDEMIRQRYGDLSPEKLAAERLKIQGQGRPALPETQLMGSGKYKFAERTGWLMPDPEDLKTLGVDDDLVELVRRHNHVNNNGLSYTLKPKEVLERYAEAVSRVHSFLLPTAPGANSIADRMSTNIKDLYSLGPVGHQKAKLLQSTYVPLALGRMTPGQLAASEGWEVTKLQAMEWLDSPMKSMLGEDTAKRFRDAILNDRSSSLPSLGSSITKWFHLSALGGSVTAAIQNLSQFVWTASTIGGKYTARGYSHLLEKVPELVNLRMTKGLSTADAVKEVFPEFHAAHLEWDAVARRELEDIVDSTVLKATSMGGKATAAMDWASTNLMAMFTASETTNRMGAFYGALQRAKDGFKLAVKEGNPIKRYNPVIGAAETVTGDKILPHSIDEARIAVSRSQFGGGYLDRPAMTTGWWAPLRQFTTFPLRTAGLLTNEGFGAGNMGLVGRGLLASGLAYSTAREFIGQDISSAMISGAIPTATEGQPFSPLPVPPIVSLVGGAAQALSGDPESLAKRLPMLVPGGVAASKTLGYLPGGSVTAPAFGKEYADYDNATPDGRVAIYDAQGSLKGYATMGEILVRAMGFSTPTATQEQEFMKMVIANRERVRSMKRDYLQALYEGDANHAQSIATAYDAAYPGTGGIPVSDSDITSLHRRRDVARSERLLESLPASLRSQFAGVLGTVAGANTDAFLGLQSGGLGSGTTITAREPMRANPVHKTKEQLGTSMHGVKLSEKLKAAGLNAPQSTGAFSEFGGFSGF